MVVTPAYSLAPDFPFPAAPEDAFHTAEWVLRHARRLKVDKLRFAVVGEEAGGNLAIALSQMLRDRGLPEPRAQWLIRPVTDPACSMHRARWGRAGASVPLEMLQRLAGYYRDYLPTPAASVHPYAAPALASRLAGLPPTLIQVAEEDALRAEGEAFAGRPADGRRAVRSPNHGRCLWRRRGRIPRPMSGVDKRRRALPARLSCRRRRRLAQGRTPDRSQPARLIPNYKAKPACA
ncbi:alpha/beta hydrolase fold domain-containing protein [Cupriavidus basilensis]